MIAVNAEDLSTIPAHKKCAVCQRIHVDFPLFTNISQALVMAAKNGESRPRIIRLKDFGLSKIGRHERLYIISHGNPGFLGDGDQPNHYSGRTIEGGTSAGGLNGVGELVATHRAPFRGVEIYACDGATDINDEYRSIVHGVNASLSEAGVSLVRTSGFTGYSYSNPYSGVTRVLKEGKSARADSIQEECIEKHHATLLQVDRYAWEHRQVDIADRADTIASMTRDLYKDLITELQGEDLLHRVGDGKSALVSMACPATASSSVSQATGNGKK